MLAIGAVVIIGLVFFFSGSPEEGSDARDTTPETQNTQNEQSEAMDEESVTVSGEADISVDDISVVSETEVGAEPAVREFTIDSFGFGYSQEEIRVNEGDTVTINLTNSGGYHDWVVDEFDAATEKINGGGETSVTFVADETGTFEYYCSVGNHREQGMVGTLIVE
jgi:plastocyanin